MSVKWYAYDPQTCREWQSADGNPEVYHSKILNCADLRWIPLALVFRGCEESLIREAKHTISRCLNPAVWTAQRARESRESCVIRARLSTVVVLLLRPEKEKKAAAAAKQTTSRFSSRFSVGWVGWMETSAAEERKIFQFATKFQMYKDGERLTARTKRKMVKWLVGFWRMETINWVAEMVWKVCGDKFEWKIRAKHSSTWLSRWIAWLSVYCDLVLRQCFVLSMPVLLSGQSSDKRVGSRW